MARALVGEKLAACVNLIPQMESIYRWEGKLEAGAETLAIIKTTTWKYDLLEARIRQLATYEVPEILAVRVQSGLPAYLRWLEESVTE